MNERQFELAQQLEQAERDAAIRLVRAQCEGAGTDECMDCGGVIPTARRQLVQNATRCTPCQSRIETRKPGWGR
ncbi:TraR/DksA C4-type zinc finger protein [Cupriavidus gilardii]|uniref:TraR/DksA C4-type zinc finger protein n=1 Tax=Cupriavidus gilardii TaxID=82541 RepID=UPI00352EDA14